MATVPSLDLSLLPKAQGLKKIQHSGIITFTGNDDHPPIVTKQHTGAKKVPSYLSVFNNNEDEISLLPKSQNVKKVISSNILILNSESDVPTQKSQGGKKGYSCNTTSLVPIHDHEEEVGTCNTLSNKQHGGKRGHNISSNFNTSFEEDENCNFPAAHPKMTGGKKGAPQGLITVTDEGEIIPLGNVHNTLQQQGSKRGAPGPLVTTSDEEETDSLPPSPRSSVASSSSVHQHSVELDHDYENVASPGGSSTASGPVYIRPPGFKHHAQEIKKVKKKKTASFLDANNGLKRRAPTPPKMRQRKEPVPMRLRALPQSFWKQPNIPNPVSPANILPSLPPLGSKDTSEDITDVRPITPPEERERRNTKPPPTRQPERKVIVTGDTDLLLKHLFDRVVDDKKAPPQIKRGRPRKVTIPKGSNTKLVTGEDPYLVDAVTEKLFPQLSLEGRQSHGLTSLQLVTLREGDKTVTLPSLSIEQNYSQMLSELAMNI
ncbi:hypothetical protein FSP39_015310 [Pinctada imbricata]|uniref:Uncharacterized protein n=1 Tax=Pinctada imbricata TaxID=66713 RepID=A0AA88YHJ4_PINIB|nr:hypothetical protein FSP39_015310 [Pinctada imbricata]